MQATRAGSQTRAELVEQLLSELVPVRGRGRTLGTTCGWLLVSWTLAASVVLATGPLRPGAFEALSDSPRFLLETLLGIGAATALGVAALRLGVPAAGARRRVAAPAVLVLVVWVAAHAIALWSPALEPSMAGKRDGCSIEVLLLGAPALALGLLAARRLAPLDRALTGALIGAAAAAAPALLMQFACMYLPAHALSHHLAPMLIPIALGAALGLTALRRI